MSAANSSGLGGACAVVLLTVGSAACLLFGVVFCAAFSLGRAWSGLPSVHVELVAPVSSSR